MNELQIAGVPILQDGLGRYRINDLHRASGGLKKNAPNEWMRLKQSSELIQAVNFEKPGIPGIESKQGLGTFVCKELVYAYAMWISPTFHLQVIRAYDSQVMQQLQAAKQPETTLPPSVGHRADHIVSASRCFNGLMRVATSLKLPHGRAVQSAMESARRHTGVDLMAELGVMPEDLAPAADRRLGSSQVDYPEEPVIVQWLNAPAQVGRDRFSNEEIMVEALGYSPSEVRSRSNRMRIGHIMSRLGWYRSRTDNGGKGSERERRLMYRRPFL